MIEVRSEESMFAESRSLEHPEVIFDTMFEIWLSVQASSAQAPASQLLTGSIRDSFCDATKSGVSPAMFKQLASEDPATPRRVV